MTAQRFPLLELAGTPYEIGYRHGSAFRELVGRSMAIADELLNVPRRTSVADARRSIGYCREQAPELMEEIRGIADGAGVTEDEVFALNAELDMLGSQRRLKDTPVMDCWASAFGSGATARGHTLVTWNAEDYARWLPVCVLLRIEPRDAPPCLTWTFAGFVGRPGLSPHLGVSAVSLATADAGDGMPYPLVCRKVLACGTVDEAIEAIASVKRMSGMDYTLGDSSGAVATVETTAGAHRVVRGTHGWVACTHMTNDGGADKLATLQTPAADSALVKRLRRVEELLAGKVGRIGIEDLKQLHEIMDRAGCARTMAPAAGCRA